MSDTVSKTLKTARRAAATPRVRGIVATKKKAVSPRKKASQLKRRWQPEQRVVLATTWKRYLAIDKAFGDDQRPGVRLNYGGGLLEIMTTSSDHERIKSTIRRCLEHYLNVTAIRHHPRGSMTRRVGEAEKASEADESYSFSREDPTRLDLAIEVALSSGGIDKLTLYAKLGCPEVWIWRRGKIQVHVLEGESYRQQSLSARLPHLPLDWISELSTWSDDYDAVAEFCRRLAKANR